MTGKVKLTSGTLNVRKGPSTGNEVVGSLRNGEAVEILETKVVGTMTWGRIAKGWISMTYVVLDKKPEDTQKPADTNKPEDTQKPEDTNKPDDTNKPADTQKPEENKPAQTVTGKVNITSGWLNVRSGAGTNYGVCGKLSAGQSVSITEQKTVGGKVWGKTKDGWVCMDYIKVDKQNTASSVEGTVDTGSATRYLRVRSEPSENAAIVERLAHGTKVKILERKTVNGVQWGRTDKGWVNMSYITLAGENSGSNKPAENKPDDTQKPEENKTVTGTVKLTSGTLNVRSAPGTGNKIVGSLRNGEKVTILETETVGGMLWGRISTGWISMNYVKTN